MAANSAWGRRSASVPASFTPAARWAWNSSPPSNMWCAATGRPGRENWPGYEKPPSLNWIRPPGPVAPGLRIGLLGGSFDPAHCGHLHVSLTAMKRLGLDYVWWLVSPGNPLKEAPAPLD